MKNSFQDRIDLARELMNILKATNHHVSRKTSLERSFVSSDLCDIIITETDITLCIDGQMKLFETPISIKNEIIVLS